MHGVGGARVRLTLAWAFVLLGCGPDPLEPQVGVGVSALGEPQDGFPNWHERVLHVWTNRARSDPQADLATCSACAEKACYAPQPPLVWSHNLARAARFHSDNLVRASCGLQHDSPCAVISTISAEYTPGPCDGSASCACQGGSAACGSMGTSFSSRVALFGTSPSAENIARGSGDPLSIFYLWLHEADSNPACGWRLSNGHRANILGGSGALGVGKSNTTYTQDFAGSGTPSGIVSGAHFPQTGATLNFLANWYRASPPEAALLNIDGMCFAMNLERGSTTNGTYLVTPPGLGAGCRRYYFHFVDGGADVFYPTTGSFGINCPNDWENTRSAPCQPSPGNDAGTVDAGSPDLGSADSGPTDAQPQDVQPQDVQPQDVQPQDARPQDISVFDLSGPADSGGTEGGSLDVSPEIDAEPALDGSSLGSDAGETAADVNVQRNPDLSGGCACAMGNGAPGSALWSLLTWIAIFVGARRTKHLCGQRQGERT